MSLADLLQATKTFFLIRKEERKRDGTELTVELKKIAYDKDNKVDKGNLVIKETRRVKMRQNCVTNLGIYVTS